MREGARRRRLACIGSAIVTGVLVVPALTGVLVVPALTVPDPAGAASPVALTVDQSTAFSYLGHSCGGIQVQVYATGFDTTAGSPTLGFPTGEAYLKTSCGGSGRGGGYRTTTYSAWIATTWDFAGISVTTSRLGSAPTPDPTLTAIDANGNEVHNSSGSAFLVLAAGFVPVPDVTGVAPQAGPTAGGTAVSITGYDLGWADVVSFGSTPASSFVVNGDTSISAVSPPEGPGTVDVTAADSAGASPSVTTDGFTFVARPVVTGLLPSRGPVSGGTPVTITGTGLTAATAVRFDGVDAPFNVNSDSSITATSPASDSSPGDSAQVTVTTVGGTSATTGASQFTYTGSCTGPCLSVGDASVLEGDTGRQHLTFPVTLSQPATTRVTVDYSVVGWTATGGTTPGNDTDFLVKSGNLSFTPAPTTDRTPVTEWVSVSVLGDNAPEPDETLSLVLSHPGGGPGLGRPVGTGTILNDDPATGPTLGIGDTSIVVTDRGKQHLRLPVTLSTAVPAPVSVSYAVTPGSATWSATPSGGGDIGGTLTGTLTLAAGQRQEAIRVPVRPDPSLGSARSFTVTISNPSGAGVSLLRATGTGTLLPGS